MLDGLTVLAGGDVATAGLVEIFTSIRNYLLIFIGFSFLIFIHELGHFLAAKWCDVRIERFAVGFGKELFGFTRGETRYSFNVLPLGGYVKMLGQDDFEVDKSGELKVKEDPRAFSHKPVGQRMIIVSAGVVANLLLAAFAFMIVFMVGMEQEPPVVGYVQAESPAEVAGLQRGDHIVSIDGSRIRAFMDIFHAVILASPSKPLMVTYKREDPETGEWIEGTVPVNPRKHPNSDHFEIGILPEMNRTVLAVAPDLSVADEERRLQLKDEILAVDGVEVSDYADIRRRIREGRSRPLALTVLRPSDEEGAPPRELTVQHRAWLSFRPGSGNPREGGDLLGLTPLRLVSRVIPGTPAEEAGIRDHDVILRWGHQHAPTTLEVDQSIAKNPDVPIPVTVLRRGEDGEYREVSLTVTPETKGWRLFGSPGKAQAGLNIFSQHFNDQLLVADVKTEVIEGFPSAAAPLKPLMPRGSLITHVNDEPLTTWDELFDRFIELAGGDVKLTWRSGDSAPRSATIYVPATLGTVFELPPNHVVTRIDDQASIEVARDQELPQVYAASHWRGAYELLKGRLGETVEVEHRGPLDRTPYVERVTVTEEMLDTWVLRAEYEDLLLTDTVRERLPERNPFVAMMIGVRNTISWIQRVYIMMERMIISRSVGLDQVAGPVGIVQMGSQVADHDLLSLLYFLAMISANLAVINFLPLPIVDGGLFLFLIIEKIKGSPISLKVQMATQLIGLALIIGIFFIVTFNDILRLVG